MGNSLVAESKLQFYPTQEIETYRLLGLLGDLQIDYIKERYLKEHVFSKEEYNQLYLQSLDSNVSFRFVIFDKWLKEKKYDLIKSYFTIKFGSHSYNNRSENFPITICDPFAGESRWLDTFKSFMPKNDYSGDILLIGNELESNRFNYFKDNPNIDEKYNKSFEELNLPTSSCSLILFNPPYGSQTNGIRNVRWYLQMIIDRKIIYNLPNSKDYKTGYMVFVIRKDDFIDSLDIICQHFDVLKNAIYKVNPEEYAKYKQYIFIARLKNNSFNLNNVTDAMDYQKHYNDIKIIIESEPEFELNMYDTYRMMNYPYVDYETAKENNQYVQVSENYISKNDSVWKWIKDITELKNLGEEKLTIPKPPKPGEIANILASGMVNGDMDLDGKGKHVVIGGTKKVEKRETNTYKDDNGEKITETKIIKMSLPYLNILCSENGELKIKELGGSE